MAGSILSSLFSTTQFTVVATDNSVKLSKLKVAKTSFKYTSRPHRSIKEDGSTVVDAKVVLQTALSITVYCETQDDLRQINNLLQNRGKLFSIYSKGIIIENVVMDSEDVKQSAEVTSAYPIELKFTEIIVQNKKPIIVKQSADSNGISAGLASITTQATQTVSGLVSAVKASAADLSRQVIGVFGSG